MEEGLWERGGGVGVADLECLVGGVVEEEGGERAHGLLPGQHRHVVAARREEADVLGRRRRAEGRQQDLQGLRSGEGESE